MPTGVSQISKATDTAALEFLFDHLVHQFHKSTPEEIAIVENSLAKSEM